MFYAISCFVLAVLSTSSSALPQAADPVSQALSQGDLYFSRHRFDLALDAFHKADKLSHHNSALAYLKIATTEIKVGDFPSALDDAKRALKVAGEDKVLAIEAHALRARVLTQMASKPNDKKLKEAEDELRQSLTIDPSDGLTHYNLGMVLLKQERDREGLAELNTFVSSPGTAEAKTVAEARRVIANPVRARQPFAPDFSFTTLEKDTVSNASLRGKVLLLDFWATWCPPCRESLPMLRNIQKKYAGKGFELVGVSSDEDEDVWRTYIAAQRMNWPEYIDLSTDVQQAFKIDSFPTYIVVDKDGLIQFRQAGLSDTTQADLEEVINKALKKPSNPTLAAAAASNPPEPAAKAQPVEASAKTSSGEVTRENRPADLPAIKLEGVEGGIISGNIYKNEALGMSYEFPKGWIPAKPESLHTMNERSEAAAKAALLQQHPELAGSMRFSMPKLIFYASRRGDGDGQRTSLPSLRMRASPTNLSSLNLVTFTGMAEQMATAASMKLAGAPTDFLVKDHTFLRADFERGSGSSHFFYSYIQTLAGDYLVTLELFASNSDDVQKIVSSFQSFSISESE